MIRAMTEISTMEAENGIQDGFLKEVILMLPRFPLSIPCILGL